MLKSIVFCLGLALAANSAFAQATNNDTSKPQEGAAVSTAAGEKSKTIGIVLFPEFETLDVFGPVQMWGRLSDHEVVFVAQDAGPVRSSQGVETLATYSFENAPQFDILMVPGGMGTRQEVDNQILLDFVRKQDAGTSLTTSVCTGAAILAKAGLLDGRKATTNKLAFKWVTSQSTKASWLGHARWVEDGKYVTSSGVSAGADMALAVVEKIYGRDVAHHTASFAEYVWNDDPNNDPFGVEIGKASR